MLVIHNKHQFVNTVLGFGTKIRLGTVNWYARPVPLKDPRLLSDWFETERYHFLAQ